MHTTPDLGPLSVTLTHMPAHAAAQVEIGRQLAELARSADGISSPTRHVILEASLAILGRIDDAQVPGSERVA